MLKTVKVLVILMACMLGAVGWEPVKTAGSGGAVIFSQAKTWGGAGASTNANQVSLDAWGNRYVSGDFTGTVSFNPAGGEVHSSNGSQDAYLGKFDPGGNFVWAKTWGGSGRDIASGVTVDSQGYVYVLGHFQNTVDFNPAGGAPHASNAGGMNNIYLSKFSPQGIFQWVRTWGPEDGGAEGYGLAIDAWDHVYVVGDFTGSQCDFNPWGMHDVHTNHPAPSGSPAKWFFDAYLSKFDSSGNFVWAKTWGAEGYDDGPGVAVDTSGNIYVGGMYASTDPNLNFDPGGGPAGLGHPAHDSGILVDVFLSKFAPDGTFQWVRTWGAQGTDEVGNSVTVDKLGHVYLGGRFGCSNCDFNPGGTPDPHSSHGDLDAFVMKVAPNGDFQWARTWGGAGADATGGLTTDEADNIYVSGLFNNTVDFGPASQASSHGLTDAFLSMFDPTGTFLGAFTWGGSGNDGSNKPGRDTSGNVYAAGWFQGSLDFDPGSGSEIHTASGNTDAFLAIFNLVHLDKSVYLPLVTR
jgi:hypothetical protein